MREMQKNEVRGEIDYSSKRYMEVKIDQRGNENAEKS